VNTDATRELFCPDWQPAQLGAGGSQIADYALVGAQCAVPEREAPTILFCASVSE
jgi:hypothetical protein